MIQKTCKYNWVGVIFEDTMDDDGGLLYFHHSPLRQMDFLSGANMDNIS